MKFQLIVYLHIISFKIVCHNQISDNKQKIRISVAQSHMRLKQKNKGFLDKTYLVIFILHQFPIKWYILDLISKI